MLIFGLFLQAVFSQSDSQSIEIPTTANSVNGMSEYIFYNQGQSWNTARSVCSSIGGYLARFDTLGLFQMAEAQSAGGFPWEAGWDHSWTSLYWNDAQARVFDDSDCSLFTSNLSVTDVFKDANNAQYDSGKRCFRLNKDSFRLERHACDGKLNFICERKADKCLYSSVGTGAAVVSHGNATSDACQEVCNAVSGCFLAGNYETNLCVMLTVPPGSNAMYQKNCFTASRNESDTDGYIDPLDNHEIPSGCTPNIGSETPGAPVTSTVVLPTISIDLCPSSTASYVYISTETLSCSPDFITVSVSQPVSYVTVTDITSVATTVIQTQTATEVLSTCHLPTSVSTSASPCAISTETLITELTSTVLVTSVVSCPSVSPVQLTITSSCPEPMTVLQEHTSCVCASAFMTSELTSVISPESASSILSSDLQTAIPGPVLDQTTICRTYNLTNLGEDELNALLASIVKELTIETKNLSKTVRKKTSAQDSRPLSQSIGYSALSLIILPFVVVILMDVPIIIKDVQKTLVNVKKTGTP
ncbi:uncharacterized protein [Haliotis cracherodii]|uniref:uncharacterized protein n=1 Tax=Haliotis cracherodii TaxID=6455 RepID=UPI0039E79B41